MKKPTGASWRKLGMTAVAVFPTEEGARAAMALLGPHMIDTLGVGISEPVQGKTALMFYEKLSVVPFKRVIAQAELEP